MLFDRSGLLAAAIICLVVNNGGLPVSAGQSAPKSWPYQIVKEEGPIKCCWGLRLKEKVYISSSAPDLSSRAQTALRAAKEIETKKRVNFVAVFMLPSALPAFIKKGVYLARAQYASDGGGTDGSSPLKHGTWEVFANSVKLSPQSLKVLELFYQTIDKHQSIILDCADKNNLEEARRGWAKLLGLSYQEFRRGETVGVGIPDLQARINKIVDASTGLPMAGLRCSIGAEDNYDAAFQEIGRVLRITSGQADKVIVDFINGNDKEYQGGIP